MNTVNFEDVMMNGREDISVNRSNEELVGEAVGGSRVALEQLLLVHYDRLVRHIGSKLPVGIRQVVTAEDILQQTFLHAFRDIGNFKARSGASFFAWLKTIAENRLIDTVKAMNRKKRGGDYQRVHNAAESEGGSIVDLIDMLSSDGRSPSQSVARHEAVQAVQIGLAALPEEQRLALQLRFIVGKSLAETAEQMGKTEGAVRGLIHRAKQNLRDGMGRSSRWLSRK